METLTYVDNLARRAKISRMPRRAGFINTRDNLEIASRVANPRAISRALNLDPSESPAGNGLLSVYQFASQDYSSVPPRPPLRAPMGAQNGGRESMYAKENHFRFIHEKREFHQPEIRGVPTTPADRPAGRPRRARINSHRRRYDHRPLYWRRRSRGLVGRTRALAAHTAAGRRVPCA